MSFDLAKILESKRALRRELAVRSIAEKLRMLDALRERTVSLRGSAGSAAAEPDALRETPASAKPGSRKA
jgi:hypothetical protein